MSWIDFDENKLEEQSKPKGFELTKPGVYKVTIDRVYIDQTSGGTKFVSFIFSEGKFPNNKEIKVEGWDVTRMIMNKEGKTENANGGYYGGLILMKQLANAVGVDLKSLKPKPVAIQLFGETKQVSEFTEFVGQEVVVGIRHRESEYNGETRTKLEVVGFCNTGDDECIEKMKKRIEKKPVFVEKQKEEKKPVAEDVDVF